MSRKRRTLLVAAVVAVILCLSVGGAVYFVLNMRSENLQTSDEHEGDGLTSRMLRVGTVAHGKQFLEPSDPGLAGRPDSDFSRLATTYYHRQSPAGRALETMNWFPGPENTYWADVRMPASLVGLAATPGGLPLTQLVGVWSEPPIAKVFLGEGSLASYGRPYQWVDFYERNRDLIKLSLREDAKPPRFTFVQHALARGMNVRVLQGPERQVLTERGPKRFYKVMVVDITRGVTAIYGTSLVSRELMTAEAMALFLECLSDDGILLIQTSSRTYDLVSTVADAACSLGCSCVVANDLGKRSPPC
jgi:hypothetical protein